MAEQAKSDAEGNEQQPIALSAFLETYPPGSLADVMNAGIVKKRHNGNEISLEFSSENPSIKIHCENCDGIRTFRAPLDPNVYTKGFVNKYIEYICSDCRYGYKTYAIRIAFESTRIAALKFGEYPPFGAPTPTRLLKILGDELETFRKGRRCENQNLGIGAFAYYRRVVENLKFKLFEEIIKVAKATNSPLDLIEGLERAQENFQFTNAMGTLKAGIPPALFIGGHNPLVLLHGALSKGIHSQSDEECLRSAHDIRLVLASIVETIAQTLKDDAELTSAVGRLSRAVK